LGCGWWWKTIVMGAHSYGEREREESRERNNNKKLKNNIEIK